MRFTPDGLIIGALTATSAALFVVGHAARRIADRMDSRDIDDATRHLRNYQAKIETLLERELPPDLIDLIAAFNTLLLSPAFRNFFEARGASGEPFVPMKKSALQPRVITEENMSLYSAFIEAAVEGIQAVSKRDPRLAKIWSDALPMFAAEPARTTSIIASEARDYVASHGGGLVAA